MIEGNPAIGLPIAFMLPLVEISFLEYDHQLPSTNADGHNLQAAPVRSCHWNPERTQLVIATGSNKVFLWSPDGASCVHVPVPAFNVNFAHWSPLGNTLLLADREYFCCAYTMQE